MSLISVYDYAYELFRVDGPLMVRNRTMQGTEPQRVRPEDQRDRLEDEVTPEMIEAGLDELMAHFPDSASPGDWKAVRDIYMAMRLAFERA